MKLDAFILAEFFRFEKSGEQIEVTNSIAQELVNFPSRRVSDKFLRERLGDWVWFSVPRKLGQQCITILKPHWNKMSSSSFDAAKKDSFVKFLVRVGVSEDAAKQVAEVVPPLVKSTSPGVVDRRGGIGAISGYFPQHVDTCSIALADSNRTVFAELNSDIVYVVNEPSKRPLMIIKSDKSGGSDDIKKSKTQLNEALQKLAETVSLDELFQHIDLCLVHSVRMPLEFSAKEIQET